MVLLDLALPPPTLPHPSFPWPHKFACDKCLHDHDMLVCLCLAPLTLSGPFPWPCYWVEAHCVYPTALGVPLL